MSDARRFARLIWAKWENSMTGSLVITFGLAVVGTIWQGVASFALFLATLMACLMIACFRVWRDEFRDKETAQAVLNDSESRIRRVLRIALLINEGRELQQLNGLNSENMTLALLQQKVWREEVREFVQESVPGVEIQRRDMSGMMIYGWDTAQAEIENDIALLETLKSSLGSSQAPAIPATQRMPQN